MPDDSAAIERLIAADLLARDEGGLRTTRRWQGAMARAAARLYAAQAPWRDLRLPIATALVELLLDADDETLASCVDAMLPVESEELRRSTGAPAPPSR